MPFDVIDWMNTYRHHNLFIYGDSIKPVQDFALIWNLFESVVCGKFATVDKVKNAVEVVARQGCLDATPYEKFLEYFRNRYGPRDGDYAHIWKGLSPTNHNKNSWPIILGTLTGQNNEVDNVKGLLLIAYRIRNNLFHGHKEIRTLNAQAELFVQVNELISIFIDQFDRATIERS